jgi:protein gp37
MAENSLISWTDHTWNPWVGCMKVSPACDGCYAEHLMDTRMGRVEWGAPGVGVGTRSRTSEHTWNDPRRWNRKAEKEGTRPFVFCASLADIFDNQVPAEWRADAFRVMRETPRLVYLLLTKRPQNIVKLAEEAGGLPPNCAIGTTVEDQTRADQNVPILLEAAGKLNPLFTFVSCEPLLGAIDLTTLGGAPIDYEDAPKRAHWINALTGEHGAWLAGSRMIRKDRLPRLGWVITGGETDQGKHKARITHPEWFHSLRDQCAASGTPYHHKQNGEYHTSAEHEPEGCDAQAVAIRVDGKTESRPSEVFTLVAGRAPGWAGMCRVGKKAAGRQLQGREHNDRPEVLR